MIVVTGYRGRLGSELIHRGMYPLDCDITDIEDTFKAVSSWMPSVVINCAAYTNVDGCEDRDLYQHAVAVNSKGVDNLVGVCGRVGARLIHISTDYIFGGHLGPYSELDVVPYEDDFPGSAYGITKLVGEAYLMASEIPYTIVRTTGLYGSHSDRPDFLKRVLEVLSSGTFFPATNDLFGNQTYIPHLVEALELLALSRSEDRNHPSEIINLASREVITRHSFAKMIAEVWGLDGDLVVSVSSDQVPGWVAKRPVHGGLVIGKAYELGLPIYSISEGLRHAHENWDCDPSV